MQNYVLGVLFNHDLTEVVLIRKNRPKWQAGFFNLPGGKVEPGESAVEAIQREIEEETGINTPDWDHFATMVGSKFRVDIYANYMESLVDVKTLTDEEVRVVKVTDFPKNTLLNVPGLISLAQVALADRNFQSCTLSYA